mgnify:CR=1 FL=1
MLIGAPGVYGRTAIVGWPGLPERCHCSRDCPRSNLHRHSSRTGGGSGAVPIAARRYCRRATPATLTGVSGRPIRASALLNLIAKCRSAQTSRMKTALQARTWKRQRVNFLVLCFMDLRPLRIEHGSDACRCVFGVHGLDTDQGRPLRRLVSARPRATCFSQESHAR